MNWYLKQNKAKQNKEVVSIAFHGNIITIWKEFYNSNIHVDLGSDQTSLHNPWAGGYYPVGLSYEESNEMMANKPEAFKEEVKKTLRRHASAINQAYGERNLLSLITAMPFCSRLRVLGQT